MPYSDSAHKDGTICLELPHSLKQALIDFCIDGKMGLALMQLDFKTVSMRKLKIMKLFVENMLHEIEWADCIGYYYPPYPSATVLPTEGPAPKYKIDKTRKYRSLTYCLKTKGIIEGASPQAIDQIWTAEQRIEEQKQRR